MRGFTLYRGVDVKHLGERADLYFKVERKSRKDKNASVITVFAVSPNENAATTTTDTDKLDDSKEVLLSLVPVIESKDVETNIANQEAQIRDAEKKLKRMQDEQVEYEAKIKTLQDKLEENRKNLDLQTLEIEKMKSFRDAMKDKQSQLGKTGS
jgi:chromosome segregation ATPase